MPADPATVEADLFAGTPIDDAELVIGSDFYEEDRDPGDSSMQEIQDPISAAVGTPGFMERHIVQECFFSTPEGAHAEPEEFDRYYFPPGDRDYEGPAPLLIDLIRVDEPVEIEREREEKHIAFKTDWCAAREIRYVVLHETDDLSLSVAQLRSKLLGEEKSAPAKPAAAKAKPAAKRGLQHPA